MGITLTRILQGQPPQLGTGSVAHGRYWLAIGNPNLLRARIPGYADRKDSWNRSNNFTKRMPLLPLFVFNETWLATKQTVPHKRDLPPALGKPRQHLE